MEQYIPKSTLVTEIKRLISICNDDENIHHIAKYNILVDILSLIDTLEVKEVDLEKEIENYLSTYWPKEKELHPFLGHIAKYFCELGMAVSNKTQKGK